MEAVSSGHFFLRLRRYPNMREAPLFIKVYHAVSAYQHFRVQALLIPFSL